MNPDLTAPSGAVLSDDGVYRYLLWRRWSPGDLLGFVMLNPSTADASADDPTIRRCIGFARHLGYGGILVGNVFAWRATDPRNLPASTDDAFGPDNAEALGVLAGACSCIIAAWGAHKRAGDLAQRVLGIIGSIDCLGTTKSGAPRHPLYLPASARPMPWPVVTRSTT
jgi:hypothetical protein